MRRFAVSALLVVLMSSAYVPTASAADPLVLLQGLGVGKAFELALPALNAVPLLSNTFKGLTVGLTSGSFSGLKDLKVNGLAMGSCDILGLGIQAPELPVGGLPCSKSNTIQSAYPGNEGSGDKSCTKLDLLGIVKLGTSCAASHSFAQDGRPAANNLAGVIDTIDVGLNLDLLKTLGLPIGATGAPVPLDVNNLVGTAQQLVGSATGLVSSVLKTVNIPLVPVQLDQLTQAIVNLINQLINNLGSIAQIQAGTSTTDITNQGVVTTITSAAAGAKVALFGTLQDALAIIDVSAARTTASWSDASGTAEASAVPAVANLKVKDLLGLTGNDFISLPIEAPSLNNLLSVLDGTPLATTIELASATPKQVGRNVSAAATAVGINALQGLGASSLGAKDGGLRLKVAASNVSAGGDLVKAEVVPAPLPLTGGPTFAFLAGAAVLSFSAALSYRKARRVRAKA
ncbi:MAG: hypothetical protein ACRDJ4_15805 [Actinomycetota bacterium]